MSDKWTFREAGGADTPDYVAFWVDAEDGTPVADVRQLGRKTTLENARLIMAAPAMRAALVEIAEMLQGNSLCVNRTMLLDLLHTAQDALGLAESGTPHE